MHKYRLILACAPLALAACATAPTYERPATPQAAEEDFVTRSPDFDPAMSLPDDWWTLYDDPALSDLVERALSANTDLRVAEANLARAQAVTQEYRAGRLPDTTLSGGGSYGDAFPGGAGATLSGEQFTTNAGMNVSWELDLFGRIGKAISAAEADAQASQAVRDGVRVLVAAETTRSYLDACALGVALQAAEGSAQASKQTLHLTTRMQAAGAAGKLDVERAAAQYARARAQVPAAQAQRQVALFELAALLGTTPSNIPAAAQACLQPPPMVVASLPIGNAQAMLRRRPDLRQAERQLAADTARIGVAVADLYPTISFGASGNFLRNDDVKGSDSFSFSLGPLLSWSFPNITVARARLRQAEAQGDASLAAFDGTVLTALKEVEQALTNVSNEGERAEALLDAQQRSAEAFRLAQLRYEAGSIAFLDVLVAQSELMDARASYASSIQQLSSARVDLFKALGGGWQVKQP